MAFRLHKRIGSHNIDLAGDTIAMADLGFVSSPLSGSSDAK
jgi:hypothetical protein